MATGKRISRAELHEIGVEWSRTKEHLFYIPKLEGAYSLELTAPYTLEDLIERVYYAGVEHGKNQGAMLQQAEIRRVLGINDER